MKIIKLKDLENPQIAKEVEEAIKRGDIIIHPTDTVYGIGCNVESDSSVKKIYEAKKRDPKKPFSVFVPSLDWVYEHCILSQVNKEFVKSLLPGPYTAVLKYKSVPKILESPEKTIGVRIVKNQFFDLARKLNVLFITTSLNISGEENVTKVENAPEELKQITGLAIDGGELGFRASRVFDLTSDDIRILRY